MVQILTNVIQNRIRSSGTSTTPGTGTTFEYTLKDITSDPVYYYYGGQDSNGDWQINRWTRDTTTETEALETSNPSYTTLNDAWNNRTTLNYLPT